MALPSTRRSGPVSAGLVAARGDDDRNGGLDGGCSAQLSDLEAQMLRTDPRFARSPAAGRPCRPRGYRCVHAWLGLALGIALLAAGVIVGNGLLLAPGLVLVGAAAHRFDRPGAHGPHRARANRP